MFTRHIRQYHRTTKTNIAKKRRKKDGSLVQPSFGRGRGDYNDNLKDKSKTTHVFLLSYWQEKILPRISQRRRYTQPAHHTYVYFLYCVDSAMLYFRKSNYSLSHSNLLLGVEQARNRSHCVMSFQIICNVHTNENV